MQKLKYILFALLLVPFTACDDFLDNPQPAQSLPSTAAFSSASDIQTAMNGLYNLAQQSGMFGTNVSMLPDIMSQNGDWQGSFTTYLDISNFQTTVVNGEVQDIWDDTYELVNHSNLIIKAVNEVDDPALTQELADQLRGEALFMRGATLFEAVRYFAQPYGPNAASEPGIPVLTEPVETFSDVTFPSRNTVEEVYNQVIADLEEAANLLPDAVARGRANRFAAMAYRAEVAFQQRDYATAASMTDEVVNSGPYALTAEPVDFFVNEGSSEEIWAVIHTIQDNPGVNASLAAFHSVNGRGGDVVISNDMKRNGYAAVVPQSQRDEIANAGFTFDDLRVSQLTSNDTFNIEKYEDPGNNADDAPIQRLAEFMLMRAEALARNDGVNQESVDLLNQVRTRAIRVLDGEGNPVDNAIDFVGYETGDFASADELIETIILERRVEMAFEGSRLHDLLRLERDVQGRPFDDNMIRLPIPQSELDANANITQNPGY